MAGRSGKKSGLARGKAEGEAEGKAEGNVQGKADALVRVLERRFPSALSADLKRLIRRTIDVDQLDHWLDQAATAVSLSEFRRQAGLTTRQRHRKNGS
jgi:hypothetical protein